MKKLYNYALGDSSIQYCFHRYFENSESQRFFEAAVAQLGLPRRLFRPVRNTLIISEMFREQLHNK